MKTEVVSNAKGQTVGYKITPRPGRKNKQPFIVPVIDVRHGEDARRRANMKGSPNSKFMRESFSAWGHSYCGKNR